MSGFCNQQSDSVKMLLHEFFEQRTRLIHLLESGEISKRYYLEQCHDYLRNDVFNLLSHMP